MYSGSSIKQGEMPAVVYATGINTFFGKAAHLVTTTESQVTSSLASHASPSGQEFTYYAHRDMLVGTLPSCIKEHRIILYCDNRHLCSYRTCDTIYRVERAV